MSNQLRKYCSIITKSILLGGNRPVAQSTGVIGLDRVALVNGLRFSSSDKQIVDRPTPYQKTKKQCILCKHKIQLDYKNPRLLSQFVSSLTGDIYDKHITGLCEQQQTILQREIKKSRRAFMMPIYYKHPKYNKDPPLFNPERPQRPNPY